MKKKINEKYQPFIQLLWELIIRILIFLLLIIDLKGFKYQSVYFIHRFSTGNKPLYSTYFNWYLIQDITNRTYNQFINTNFYYRFSFSNYQLMIIFFTLKRNLNVSAATFYTCRKRYICRMYVFSNVYNYNY